MIRNLTVFFLAATAAFLFSTGCSRNSPPPPLPEGQIAAEFQKAFAKASPAAKDLSSQVASAVTAKKYPAAFEGVQMLQSVPDLTKEQQALAVRAMVTISSILQNAGAQGDQDAASTIKQYRSNR